MSTSKAVSVSYTLDSHIGGGGYGLVFRATELDTQQTVAIKKSRVSQRVKRPSLQHEARILQLLQGHPSIPQLHGYGHLPHFEYIAMELLGKDTKSICREVSKDHNKRLQPKTVASVIEQVLAALKHVNLRGIVNRDVKPDNILCSMQDPSKVTLIDFGISLPRRHGLVKRYDPVKDGKTVVGTLNFASINAHEGYDLGPRDDLESLAYTALFLRLGTLPWMTSVPDSLPMKILMQRVHEAKALYPPSEGFGANPPEEEYVSLLHYARGLDFDETPDYDTWITRFRALAERLGHAPNEPLDWLPGEENVIIPSVSESQEFIEEEEDVDEAIQDDDEEEFSDSYYGLDIADYDLHYARDKDLTLSTEQGVLADGSIPRIVHIVDPDMKVEWRLD